MSEDYVHKNITLEAVRRVVLEQIRLALLSMDNDINDFQLVDYHVLENDERNTVKDIDEELNIVVTEKDLSLVSFLNVEQKNAYDIIVERVMTRKGGIFFVDGPGGTEVLPKLFELALGVNFARDWMQEKGWLSLVAVHSNSWLLAIAFYFGARFGFGKSERMP
uniref:PHD finger protein ALFIN-LIKE n=1 Tax=Cannabis sativa TaxID=3483 RepID=A0A803Q6D9_CANSA